VNSRQYPAGKVAVTRHQPRTAKPAFPVGIHIEGESMSFDFLAIAIPDHLKERQYFTYEEFGSMAGGKKRQTVSSWVRRGLVKYTQYAPRTRVIHISEVERLRSGKLMDKREEQL
jgi:hypothetical protein